MSAPPFDEANIGHHVGDVPAAVDENRRRLAARLGIDERGWAWLRQVHGTTVVDGEQAARAPEPVAADAAVTTRPGLPLVVQTADCAPLALANDDAVAVVHAGWPGLLNGIIPAAVERLRSAGRGPVRAALGPCVHPCCYEFGRADLDRIVAVLGDTVESCTSDGAPALDIPAAVRVSLERCGVDDLHDVDICTATSPDHFSYRRDGRTGRQALVAVLDE